LNEDKTLKQLVTAPLQKHFVAGCAANVKSQFDSYSFVQRLKFNLSTYRTEHTHLQSLAVWWIVPIANVCAELLVKMISKSFN
jgi:hypothetical protein